MTVVSRPAHPRRPAATRGSRTTRAGRSPRAGRGPTRDPARMPRRYLAPALLSGTPTRQDASARKPSYTLWFVMAADLAAVIWLYTFGDWLDHASKLTATATLGGHHYIVLAAAAIAFLTLATVAILTDGFTRTTRTLTILKTAACILSLTVLTGLAALLLAALLSRLLFGSLRP